MNAAFFLSFSPAPVLVKLIIIICPDNNLTYLGQIKVSVAHVADSKFSVLVEKNLVICKLVAGYSEV